MRDFSGIELNFILWPIENVIFRTLSRHNFSLNIRGAAVASASTVRTHDRQKKSRINPLWYVDELKTQIDLATSRPQRDYVSCREYRLWEPGSSWQRRPVVTHGRLSREHLNNNLNHM